MSVKRIIGAVALTALIAGAVVVPASTAGATVTGAVGLTCTATLPSFPTNADNGTCSGTSVGVGAGLTDGGAPYAIAGPGTFNADFVYNEACVAGEPPVLGSAVGRATVTGGTSTHGAFTLGTNFAWTRVGVVAVILTNGTEISFASGDHATAVAPDVGVAAFAPLLGTDNVCPNGGDLTAVVVGADVSPI